MLSILGDGNHLFPVIAVKGSINDRHANLADFCGWCAEPLGERAQAAVVPGGEGDVGKREGRRRVHRSADRIIVRSQDAGGIHRLRSPGKWRIGAK